MAAADGDAERCFVGEGTGVILIEADELIRRSGRKRSVLGRRRKVKLITLRSTAATCCGDCTGDRGRRALP